MFRRLRTNLRREPARAQVLVEFGLSLLVIVPFLVLLSVMLLSLYQASSVNQGAAWLGQRLTTTGTACADGSTSCNWVTDFKNQMAALRIVVSPADTIAISITSPDGTVRYFDRSQETLVPTTAYGDTVMVRFVKPLTGGMFVGSGMQSFIESMPGSSDTWIGVAQMEKGSGSSGIPVAADFGLNYTATVAEDAPRAYWRLSESGGASFGEASGDSSKTGTIGPAVGVGVPPLITAGADSAFSLDGASGSWLSVPDSGALDFGPGSTWSAEFWLARSRDGIFGSGCSASEEPLVVRGNSSIVLSRAASCGGDSGSLDRLSVVLGSGLRLSAASAIMRDTTHHIVVSYDGSHLGSGYVEVHISIDGLDAALRHGPYDTATVSPNRFSASTVSGWAGWAGTLFWGAQNSGSGSERFDGTLDELAIYDRPLSSDLVWLHHVAGVKSGNVAVDAGRTVYFQDLSNGMPSSWSWDFNGEGSSAAQNPGHAFATTGSKDVSLTVHTVVGDDQKTYHGLIEVQTATVRPAFGFNYAAQTEALAPVSYWRLDEGSGTTMTDTMGHVSGTYSGSVSFGSGLLAANSDRALVLGSSAFSASAPDNAALDTSAFSVSMLILRTRVGTAEDLWSRDNVSLGISADNRLELRFGGGSVRSNVVLASGCPHPQDCIYDIVATYANGHGHLFVNGADVSAISGSIPPALTTSGITHLGGTSAPFAGTIDEVAFYSSALSSAEVSSLDDYAYQSAISTAVGDPVAFVDQTSGPPSYVSWDFGDGGTSNDAAPVHHYAHIGTYTVRLTVESGGRWSSVVSKDLVTVHG